MGSPRLFNAPKQQNKKEAESGCYAVVGGIVGIALDLARYMLTPIEPVDPRLALYIAMVGPSALPAPSVEEIAKGFAATIILGCVGLIVDLYDCRNAAEEHKQSANAPSLRRSN